MRADNEVRGTVFCVPPPDDDEATEPETLEAGEAVVPALRDVLGEMYPPPAPRVRHRGTE